jgi:hypothetical protein
MKTHALVEEGCVGFRQGCNVTVCLSKVFKMAAVGLDTQPGRYSAPTVPHPVASVSDGPCLNRKYLQRLLVAHFPKCIYMSPASHFMHQPYTLLLVTGKRKVPLALWGLRIWPTFIWYFWLDTKSHILYWSYNIKSPDTLYIIVTSFKRRNIFPLAISCVFLSYACIIHKIR